ncbi:hypothetical protein CL634_06240 [bacterium]|nr:hypothetical protein [bacterium]|tara:strand:- start:468 stop:659 length:192 start_codon:yes stop_codon:yes gene_type:complete
MSKLDQSILFEFDKFIKDIQKKEIDGWKRIEDHAEGQHELPQRKYNRLYKEHWQNSTRYEKKK